MRILVTGASGRVGRGVLEGLRAAGVPVRALARSSNVPAPPGVEVVPGDLRDAPGLTQALQGVSAVFLYAERENVGGLVDAMKGSGVEQVVVLSTIDATSDRPYAQHNRRRHREVEDAVVSAGFRHTLLRPGAFASNALRFWRDDIVRTGVVRLPFPESEQAPIDERDVAAVAVRALLSRDLDGQALVLTGPASLTQRAQVDTIGRVVGRAIRVETATLEEARIGLARVIPAPYVQLLLAQWSDEIGARAIVTDVVEQVTGRRSTAYAAWVARHVDALRAVEGGRAP